MSKRYPGGIIRKTPQTPSQTSAKGVWDMASVTQAVKDNTWPIAGVPDPISKSLRFRSSASASLSRTPASASNRTTWTWSGWVKRAEITTTERTFFSAGTDGNNFTALAWNNNNLFFQNYTSGSQVTATTTAVYRDPSAWYHIVLAIDTTQGTAANRAKIYVNGVQQDGFNGSSFSSSQQFWINFTYTHRIGSRQLLSADSFSEQYLTEVYFIDGQALTPSSFGTTDDQTGVWEPIAYTGTYGTNGFYLPFSNTASTTTLGYDFSGNSNNWTTNNISLTSGSTYDSMVDVPTQWIPYNTAGDTGALYRGNYCVLNPLDNRGGNTTSDGNLKLGPTTGASWKIQPATLAVSSGKWYFESVQSASANANQFACGVVPSPTPINSYTNLPSSVASAGGWSFQLDSTSTLYFWYNYSGSAQYVTISTSFGTSDVAQIAVDIDSGKIWVGKNNTWYDSSGGTTGNPATGANPTASNISGTIVPFLGSYGTTTAGFANFGQRPFSYTPPAGFKTLCTTNLSTPTIGATASTQAGKYFGISLWTGNGSTGSRAITGLGFKPDWVWWKNRTTAKWHQVFDSNRGADKALSTNATDAEDASGGYGGEGSVTAFDSDGYTLQGGVGNNENGSAIVGWAWQAGQGTNSTNTAGSITSTVSANTTAGFSIVTYTGSGSAATVGHGLGVAPRMIIIKDRDNGTYDWNVYHASLSSPTTLKLYLNTTDAETNGGTNSGTWNSTAPTSTVFSLGTFLNVNKSGDNFVAYCFAQVAGYSAFGSYTGNGSSDGPFVFCGFRPRYIVIKRSSGIEDWRVFDTARSTYNIQGATLYPNTSGAENSGQLIDINSNGFKCRTTDAAVNGSGSTYIYMAFAEVPFKYALGR
jgi:hypothetical protein